MYITRLFLSLMILPYFIFPPSVHAQSQFDGVKREMFYQKVLSIAETKTARVMKKLPPGNVMLVQAEKSKAVKAEIEAKTQSLETASNAEFAMFKKELIKLNEQELGTMRAELQGFLEAMTDSEVAALGDSLKASAMYEDLFMEFENSYTMIEKKKILTQALMKDLSFLRSVYNKKIGLASKSDIKKDLQENLLVFERSNSQKGEVGKILQISLIVLAGLALVTWGISSAVYGARLKRVKSERETQLTELKKNLEAQYNQYKDTLTKNELDYLDKNGFVRTVCGNFQQPDSILCNGYGYKLYTGTKFCSVYCFKNLTTGKETLHEPAVCTSPFIPDSCYSPKEYWVSYDVGKKEGYEDGYEDGYSSGRSAGESDGRSKGDSDGYDAGYRSGYSAGYGGGKKSLGQFMAQPRSEEFKRGYKDGLEQYQILFLNH